MKREGTVAFLFVVNQKKDSFHSCQGMSKLKSSASAFLLKPLLSSSSFACAILLYHKQRKLYGKLWNSTTAQLISANPKSVFRVTIKTLNVGAQRYLPRLLAVVPWPLYKLRLKHQLRHLFLVAGIASLCLLDQLRRRRMPPLR